MNGIIFSTFDHIIHINLVFNISNCDEERITQEQPTKTYFIEK